MRVKRNFCTSTSVRDEIWRQNNIKYLTRIWAQATSNCYFSVVSDLESEILTVPIIKYIKQFFYSQLNSPKNIRIKWVWTSMYLFHSSSFSPFTWLFSFNFSHTYSVDVLVSKPKERDARLSRFNFFIFSIIFVYESTVLSRNEVDWEKKVKTL